MFVKIAVAYDESPEAARALATAIRLAKTFGSELRAITIKEDSHLLEGGEGEAIVRFPHG